MDSSDEEELQTSDSESSSGDASDSGSTPASSDDDETTESSDGVDESDVESTTSSALKQKRPLSTQTRLPARKKAKNTTSTAQIAPKPFKAPSGYEPLTLSASDYASDVEALFGNTAGKQVWHISAPAMVSIESIKAIDIQAIARGEPVFSKNGVNYTMLPNTADNEAILLPEGTRSGYRHRAIKIERSLDLRESSKRSGPDDKTPLVFTATEPGQAKAIRKQPQGLKMRYVPFGVTALNKGPGDTEMTDAFQVPADVIEETPRKTSKKSKASTNHTSHEKSQKVRRADMEKQGPKKVHDADHQKKRAKKERREKEKEETPERDTEEKTKKRNRHRVKLVDANVL